MNQNYPFNFSKTVQQKVVSNYAIAEGENFSLLYKYERTQIKVV